MQKIQIGGQVFPIRFDMNVLESVQERYGGLSDLFSKIQKIPESKWLLTQLIQEGIAYQAYTTGVSERAPTEQDIGMLMTVREMRDGRITQTIVDAFNDCFGDEKNVTAGELIETARKIQESTSPA